MAALERGQLLFAGRDFPGARAAFQEAVDKDSGSASAHYWLGRAYVVASTGMSYSRALVLFERALLLDPKLGEAHWGRGIAHFALSRFEEAEQEFQAFLAGAGATTPPQMCGEAHHFLGVIARNRGDIERALAEFADALRLYPTFVEPWYERGLALEANGQLDAALADFTEATRREPNHLPSHFRLARLYRRLGREAEAVREEKIHRILNQLTDNLSARGLREPARRIDLYGELAGLDPGNGTARLEYAKALAEEHRDVEAALALDELLRSANAPAEAFIVRAQMALHAGDREKAAELVAQLLRGTAGWTAERLPAELKPLVAPK